MIERKRVLYIVNPVAGRRRSGRGLEGVVGVFGRRGYDVDVRYTAYKGHAGELASAFGADYDLIVCAGGDGTLNETVNGMMRSGIKTPVGYIPAGSANDLAGSLGLPPEPLRAAESVAQGTERPVDLIRFGDRWFMNAGEFGAFTWLGYTTPQLMKNALGPTAYIVSGIRDLPLIRPQHMRLVSHGVVTEGEYIFGAICNTTRIGAVALPAGVEAPDDGMFEVLLVRKPATLPQWQQIILELMTKSYPSENVDFLRTDEMEIETDESVSWNLDGERLEAPLHTSATIVPAAVTLVMKRKKPLLPRAAAEE